MVKLEHRLLFTHSFALLNPLQVEAALWSDLATTPIVPNKIKVQAELMPRLFTLRGMSDDTCSNLLERARRHEKYSRQPFFSALLFSDADTVAVAAHLSRRLLGDAPDGSHVLFRYFDPRVFSHLKWLLDTSQMALLMGRVTRWSWRNAAGDWEQHERVGAPSALSRLHLTPEQSSSLRRLGLLNKTLDQLKRVAPGIALDDRLAKRADALLHEAHAQHRLTDAADRRLYAEQAIVFHPAIHTHPQLLQRLARTREATTSYIGACRDLTPTTLRALAAELAPPTRTLA